MFPDTQSNLVEALALRYAVMLLDCFVRSVVKPARQAEKARFAREGPSYRL